MEHSKGYGRIYVLTNTANGKVYVGQTIQPLNRRWNSHVWASRHRPTMAVSAAIRKYGPEAFTVTLVEECQSRETLDEAERRWIDHLNSLDPAKGYNKKPGGQELVTPKGHVPWNKGRRFAPTGKLTEAEIAKRRGAGYVEMTEERKAEILRRVLSGESQRDLAAALGMSRPRIMRLVATHKAAAPDYQPRKKPGAGFGTRTPKTEEILRRVLAGEHRPSLAREYGLSRGRVTAIIRSARRSGIEVPRGRSK